MQNIDGEVLLQQYITLHDFRCFRFVIPIAANVFYLFSN